MRLWVWRAWRCAMVALVAVGAVGVAALTGSGAMGAAATPAYTYQLNVPYGADPVYQDMDIYLPTGVTAPTPVVILVHGGSFNAGDKSQQDLMAAALATVGWAAIPINYRLTGYPEEPEDVLSALAWVRANAASLNINPNRMAIQGSSSGGTLVEEAIMDAGALGGSAAGIQAMSSWSGPTDFTSLISASGLSPDVVSTVQSYLGCSLSLCPGTYAEASPVSDVASSDPPSFLATGSVDPAVPESQANELSADFTNVGVTSQVFVIPGSLHGQLYEPEAMQPMVNFFETYLGPTTGPVPAISTPPTVSSVGPSVYPGEVQAQLVLSGTLFDPDATVYTDAPGVTVGRVYVPTRQTIMFGVTVSTSTPPGTYNVVEANPDGTGAQCTGCLTVTADPLPTLTAVSPSSIGPNNTLTLTATGTGFVSNSSLSVPIPGVTLVQSQDRNSVTMTMTIRLSNSVPIGPGSVTVTTAGGSATCAGCLVVDPPPQPTGAGTLTAGSSTLITVTGTGFVNGINVLTNISGATVGTPVNVTATSFQVQITVPAGTASGSGYMMRLQNPDGGVGYFTHLKVA